MAIKNKKPYLTIDLRKKNKASVSMIQEWAINRKIRVVNIAGPRESKVPGIYEKAKAFLDAILFPVK